MINMNKFCLSILMLFCVCIVANAQTFKIVSDDAKQRIDVLIDGKLFTSYRYEERIRRPVLLPIITSGGNFVTRGFPIETRNSEDIGHPHQVGSSLSFGDVNGIDFWNNSPYRTPKELEHMGRIVHRKVLKRKAGKGKAELVTQSDWLSPKGEIILIETSKYIFNVEGSNRIIDRETTLKAINSDATFGDNKEGFFAIHVARELQQRAKEPEKITDEKGNITETTDNSKVTGEYLNSEGLIGDKIWGMLGKWASVSGRIADENVTVAVFDSPKNMNFPSRMMIRRYGLLSLNPFGRKIYDSKLDERKTILEKGKSITFRHRILIASTKSSPENLDKFYQKFAK